MPLGESGHSCMELYATENSKPPEGLKAGQLVTPDGATLRYATAKPIERPIRGTVTILTGRGDYIERYYETIGDLLKRRYAVAIFDWRGQGLSSRLTRNRLRGHIRSFRQYETDLHTFVRQIVLPECPAPHFAIGYSMGGHVLLHAAWRHQWFERVMLVSPLIQIRKRRMPRWWWQGITRLAVMLGFGRMFIPGQRRRPMTKDDFPGNPLTSDPTRFAREAGMIAAHPDLAVAGPTMGWLRAAIASCARLQEYAENRQVPLWPMLMVAAGEERFVDVEASRNFARDVAGIACIVMQGARHDLFQESDRYRRPLWAAFDSFISQEAPDPEAALAEVERDRDRVS